MGQEIPAKSQDRFGAALRWPGEGMRTDAWRLVNNWSKCAFAYIIYVWTECYVAQKERGGAGVSPLACMWDTQALVKKLSIRRLFFGLPAHTQGGYKINWGTSKLWSIYLSKYPFQLGNTRPEVIRRSALIGARGKTFIEQMWKQSKEIIWLAIA